MMLLILTRVLLPESYSPGQEKSRFDVEDVAADKATGLAKVEGVSMPGWKLTRTVAEAALLREGFFTFGTRRGISLTGLDSSCGITFGHPFARTSYPLLHIDGRWGKPGTFFNADSVAAAAAGDSLVLSYPAANMVGCTLAVRLEEGGTVMIVSCSLRNLDIVSHTLGLGFVVDPALGKWGDGQLVIGGAPVSQEAVREGGAATSGGIEIRERISQHPGMRLSLEFPAGGPSRLIAGDWANLYDKDTPELTFAAPQTLYDLVVNMSWTPSSVPPSSVLTKTLLLRLLPPDFGDGVFMRWDMPDHVTLAGGVVFPASIPSVVHLTNLVSSARPAGEVAFGRGEDVIPDSPPSPVNLGPGASGYAKLPVAVSETYLGSVLPLALFYREGGVLIDSLVRPVFVPATPVTDTGLVVKIDSLGFPHPTSVQTFFEVARAASGQRVLDIAPRNVFLYDNGARVEDFTLLRDTTGRSSNSDIVFVLDVTGSMTGIINSVKENIVEFADSLKAQRRSCRLAMVTFLDVIENVYDFTPDIALFKSYVDIQYAHGGDDTPENSLDALYRASELSFQTGAQRLVIWITDANYHESDEFTSRTRKQVIDRLLQTDLTVNAIGQPYYQTDWYDPIVNATGGMYYDINGKFRDILLDISRHQSSPRFMLTFTPASASSHALTLWVHYAGLGGSASTTYALGAAGVATRPLQCFPNPFNPQTTFRMEIPGHARASLTIYSILGQEVRRFAEVSGPGTVHLVWDARDARGAEVAAGVYFVRFDLRSPSGELLARDFSKIIYLK